MGKIERCMHGLDPKNCNMLVTIEQKGEPYVVEKKIAYLPEIQNIKFITPDNVTNTFSNYFDAVDIVEDTQRLFEVKLPEKIIMLSPFFEIFSNAFANMAKAESLYRIDLNIHKKRDEIIVTVINNLDDDYVIDDKAYQLIDESAGLQANKLFFNNIGGSFIFSYDKPARQAIAKATINLLELTKY